MKNLSLMTLYQVALWHYSQSDVETEQCLVTYLQKYTQNIPNSYYTIGSWLLYFISTKNHKVIIFKFKIMQHVISRAIKISYHPLEIKIYNKTKKVIYNDKHQVRLHPMG